MSTAERPRMDASDPWTTEALRARTRASDADLAARSWAFVRACLEPTIWRGETELLSPTAVADRARLDEAAVEALAIFRSDWARYRQDPESAEGLFASLPLRPTLLAVYFYRLQRALFLAEVRRLPDVLAALARHLSGVEIYYSAKIGPGLKIIHGLATVIGAQCTLGAGFTIYQGATIGDKLGRETGPRPVVGDQVIVCAGAHVLGPIEIGSQTVVGANAVVLESLPARCVAAGAPARPRVEALTDEAFHLYWDALKG